MKKILVLLLAVSCLFSCKKTPGSLTGNVFWKYNEYVGNKPDAGAEIFLYSLDPKNKGLKYEAISDVQGDYKIEGIEPGKYFLVIKSENTTSSPTEALTKLRAYQKEFLTVYGLDLSKYEAELKELNSLNVLYDQAIFSEGDAGANLLEAHKIESQIGDKLNAIFEKFPNNVKLEGGFISAYGDSKKYEVIEIKEGESVNRVTDFGTTYM